MEAAALAALLGLEVHSVVGLAPCSPPAPGGAWGATVVCGICPHRLVFSWFRQVRWSRPLVLRLAVYPDLAGKLVSTLSAFEYLALVIHNHIRVGAAPDEGHRATADGAR
jgi:hypothetical protein